MGLFTLEHSKHAYRTDFAVYGLAVLALMTALLTQARGQHGTLAMAVGLTLAGLLGWTMIEYLLHRFVLHGLQPFQRWHAAHHERPMALISAPTLLSGALIAALVFLPAWLCSDLWHACALTLGVVAGYLAYSVTHHATHHWRADMAWLKQRKRWHARHHHLTMPCCYGVTSGVWDHVFGTAGSPRWRSAALVNLLRPILARCK